MERIPKDLPGMFALGDTIYAPGDMLKAEFVVPTDVQWLCDRIKNGKTDVHRINWVPVSKKELNKAIACV